MSKTAIDLLEELANEDLTQVDTSFPILAVSEAEFRIAEATRETAESGFEYLLFKCELISENCRDTNGSPVRPGYKLRHMIGLTPSNKSIKEVGEEEAKKQIKVRVVQFLKAIGNLTFDPSLTSYVNATFFAKTRVSKERTDQKTGITYAPQAEFATFIPKV